MIVLCAACHASAHEGEARFDPVGDLHCSRFHRLFLRLHVRSEVEKIIHRMAEILITGKRRLATTIRSWPSPERNLNNYGARFW